MYPPANFVCTRLSILRRIHLIPNKKTVQTQNPAVWIRSRCSLVHRYCRNLSGKSGCRRGTLTYPVCMSYNKWSCLYYNTCLAGLLAWNIKVCLHVLSFFNTEMALCNWYSSSWIIWPPFMLVVRRGFPLLLWRAWLVFMTRSGLKICGRWYQQLVSKLLVRENSTTIWDVT